MSAQGKPAVSSIQTVDVLSQEENQQVFVLNGIQTMSGYVYNLGNELESVQCRGLVDIVRLSPVGDGDICHMLVAFALTKTAAHHYRLPRIATL